MKRRKLKIILSLLIVLVVCGVVIVQSPGNNENALQLTVHRILTPYSPENVSDTDARAVQEAFRNAELRGSPELDKAIKNEGFDPEKFKRPPLSPNEPHDTQPGPHKPQGPGKIFNSLATHYGPADFKVFSSAVNENNELLQQYKCEYKDNHVENSIPVRWQNIPENTKSLAVVMYHYPNPEDVSHANAYLLLWGIDPQITDIPYGLADKGSWFMGSNKDGNAVSYTSPCSQSPGSHSYTIAVFALAETPATLPKESAIDVDFLTLMTAIENTEIVGKAELTFTDKKS